MCLKEALWWLGATEIRPYSLVFTFSQEQSHLRFAYQSNYPHMVHITENYRENNNNELTTGFTNFVPIEHIWDTIGRAFAILYTLPRTIHELKAPLLQEWERLLQGFINCFDSSMMPCYVAYMTVKGIHTPY